MAPTNMQRFISLCAMTVLPLLFNEAASAANIEAGKVNWGRDLNAALSSCQQTGKPVFALFQEIPGCAGCQQFGKEVLSHPLIVEAIETAFTPLLIHNNKGGEDAKMLQRFGEPAWNYQVVRFLNADAADILPRKDKVWDVGGIAARMTEALRKANRTVPGYLSILAAEHSPRLQQAAFSMPCFWSGEMALGQIEGVVATEAGFMGGREVVRLSFDPETISPAKLNAAAQAADCHPVSGHLAFTPAPASDQKKQLSGTPLEKLSLSPAQSTKANAWIRVDASKALNYLSPAQKNGSR